MPNVTWPGHVSGAHGPCQGLAHPQGSGPLPQHLALARAGRVAPCLASTLAPAGVELLQPGRSGAPTSRAPAARLSHDMPNLTSPGDRAVCHGFGRSTRAAWPWHGLHEQLGHGMVSAARISCASMLVRLHACAVHIEPQSPPLQYSLKRFSSSCHRIKRLLRFIQQFSYSVIVSAEPVPRP
jgi:hypothetical protein